MDCLFCKIVNGDIPATFVKKTELINKHFENIGQVSNADANLTAQLFKAAAEIASELGLESYRLNINTGADAGQSVFHAHLHLLAGRAFAWPPG